MVLGNRGKALNGRMGKALCHDQIADIASISA
jgi:hypothetical protein